MDFIDGFAKSTGLSRQEAADQVSSLDCIITDFDDYEDGLDHGRAFAEIYNLNSDDAQEEE